MTSARPAGDSSKLNLRVLVGRTGAGKTEALHALAQLGERVLDLEALARHRGSSFGALGYSRQPSDREFQQEILALLAMPGRCWLEHEGPYLGSVSLPRVLVTALDRAPAVELVADVPSRVARLVLLYADLSNEALIGAVERLRSRLLPARAEAAVRAIKEGRRELAVRVLLPYYDRAYVHQQRWRTGPVRAQLGVSGYTALEVARRVLEVSG
jgi:tRNA 2-selenouridine synthase